MLNGGQKQIQIDTKKKKVKRMARNSSVIGRTSLPIKIPCKILLYRWKRTTFIWKAKEKHRRRQGIHKNVQKKLRILQFHEKAHGRIDEAWMYTSTVTNTGSARYATSKLRKKTGLYF